MRILFLVFVFCSPLMALEVENAESSKLSHESEAGVVVASGNNDTQTYNLKQTTDYKTGGNDYTLTGSFLLGKTAGVETAKRWDLGLKYAREIFDQFAGVVGYQIDANPYAGTQLRHTVDVGGKYPLFKSETDEISSQLGYRFMSETLTNDNGLSSAGNLDIHLGRIYVEAKSQWNESLSTKVWLEFLQSFSNSADIRVNLEPSLSVLLSQTFSVKLAYLVNHRGVPAVAGKKQTDTTFTTSLVAKL